MERKQNRQPDPFTAGDPTMPWDRSHEYVPFGASETPAKGDADKGASTTNPAQGQRVPRAKATPKQPSQPRGGGAPKGRTSQAMPKPATKKTAKKGKKRSLGGIVALIVLAIALAPTLGGVVSCVFSGDGPSVSINTNESGFSYNAGSSSDGLDYDTYDKVQQQLEDQAVDALKARLADAGNDQDLVKRAADGLNAQFVEYSGGVTLADVGMDGEAIVRWSLAGATWGTDDDEAPTSSLSPQNDADTSWDGGAYGLVYLPDANQLVYDLSSYVQRSLLKYENRPLTDEERQLAAKKGQALTQSLSDTSRYADRYVSVDVTGTCNPDGSGAEATVDEDSWLEQYDDMFGIR